MAWRAAPADSGWMEAVEEDGGLGGGGGSAPHARMRACCTPRSALCAVLGPPAAPLPRNSLRQQRKRQHLPTKYLTYLLDNRQPVSTTSTRIDIDISTAASTHAPRAISTSTTIKHIAFLSLFFQICSLSLSLSLCDHFRAINSINQSNHLSAHVPTYLPTLCLRIRPTRPAPPRPARAFLTPQSWSYHTPAHTMYYTPSDGGGGGGCPTRSFRTFSLHIFLSSLSSSFFFFFFFYSQSSFLPLFACVCATFLFTTYLYGSSTPFNASRGLCCCDDGWEILKFFSG